jgi:hypothetical protein
MNHSIKKLLISFLSFLSFVTLSMSGLPLGLAHGTPGAAAPSTGGVPYLSFHGTLASNSDFTLIYTVPNDRVFILTGLDTIGGCEWNSTGCYGRLKVNDNIILKDKLMPNAQPSNAGYRSAGGLTTNQARIVIPAGATIKLSRDQYPGGNEWVYSIQGYLAHPGQ